MGDGWSASLRQSPSSSYPPESLRQLRGTPLLASPPFISPAFGSSPRRLLQRGRCRRLARASSRAERTPYIRPLSRQMALPSARELRLSPHGRSLTLRRRQHWWIEPSRLRLRRARTSWPGRRATHKRTPPRSGGMSRWHQNRRKKC